MESNGSREILPGALDEKQLRPLPTAGKERRYWLTPGLDGEFRISVADDSGHKVFEIVYPRERSEETGRFQIHDAAGSEIAQLRWPRPSWFSSVKSFELLLGDVPAGT